ncbi:hypothetical protein STENM327S_01606 [Streptomyces tendae]
MCYPAGEFRTGASDVLLGELAVDGMEEPVEFWMSRSQYETWRHTRLIVDVVPGRGSGFSLEAPEGVRFLIRSHVIDVESHLRPGAGTALRLRLPTMSAVAVSPLLMVGANAVLAR